VPSQVFVNFYQVIVSDQICMLRYREYQTMSKEF
jgi:hypothetical protein